MKSNNDEAYDEAKKQSPGDGEGRHNRPGCGGSFRPLRNPDSDPDEDGPDAVVCPGCGATRYIANMNEEPDQL